MEQLRKQRAKAKAGKEKETSSAGEADAAGEAADDDDENFIEDRADHSPQEGNREKRKTMGKFRYDPLRKAYFPVSSKKYNPNDVYCSAEDDFDVNVDYRTMGNSIEQIAFRLSNGREVNRGRNNYCPSRMLLHAYRVASEITSASVLRRHRLRSEMASVLHFAGGGIHLRPAARRVITGGAGGDEIWQSLLEPLPHCRESPYSHSNERSIPTDCLCKHELHPSARTFDVMASHGGQGELPQVVTIIGGGSNGNNIHYRESRSGSEDPFTLRATRESKSRPDSSSARRYHCVRFAPFMAGHRLQNSSSAVMGALSTDALGHDNCSTLTLHRGPTNADVAKPFVTKELISSGSANERIDSMMNDFVFSPNATTAAPGIVALAPGMSSKRRGKYRPIFLDFETMQTLTQPREWKFVSEVLCVEHLNRDDSDGLLYGHRNGVVSILDYRSSDLIYTGTTTDDFGSITTLESLAKIGKPNEFLAKGSFGSCRLFDIRKLGNNDFTDTRRAPALVHEMFYLDTKPSQRLAHASSGCVGMAIDATGTTLLSSCTKGGAEPVVCLGVWNLTSGIFLREMSLASDLYEAAAISIDGGRDGTRIGYESNAGQTPPGSRYCELIGGATRSTRNNESSGKGLGAWVKFDPQLPYAVGGAIHNVCYFWI